MIALLVVAGVMAASPISASTLVYHASVSGRPTLDGSRDRPGNPFASAVVSLLQRRSLKLSQLSPLLKQLTWDNSNGFQTADVPRLLSHQDFQIVPSRKAEKRIALVMVVSDYSGSEGAESLPGAKYDAIRIAKALRQVGFQTELALDLGLLEMKTKLAAFRSQSQQSDAAVIYTTGHGLEFGGSVFLLPGDYPVKEGNSALKSRALLLREIAASTSAKQMNLVFYAGCRDNPFGG